MGQPTFKGRAVSHIFIGLVWPKGPELYRHTAPHSLLAQCATPKLAHCRL